MPLKTILTTIIDKDPTATAERSWSFGWKSKSGHLQSSMSSTWSAAKQLQAIAGSLAPPCGAEMNGLALSIYTRSFVLVFVTWVLVAAVPNNFWIFSPDHNHISISQCGSCHIHYDQYGI
ncbi:hypothetical protein AAC387_Pa08g1460 [Persea americana]